MSTVDGLLDRVALAAQRRLARGLLRLPRTVLTRMCGGAVVVDGQHLDPQAQVVLALARRIGRPHAQQLGIQRARRQLEIDGRVLAPTAPEMARIKDMSAEGPAGPIPLRVYVPRSRRDDRAAAALVYFHGGGFALGSLESHDAVCRVLADRARCVVVAVDYRLAPEHKFPAAVDDALAAFDWLLAHATALGLDPARIAVGGDSAGGNLAAVLCQSRRQAGAPLPVFQLLIYPATDMSRSMPSHQLFREGFFLDFSLTGWFLDQYLRSPADIDDVRASPIRADDLTGLPPALVLTAGFDPLRDEGEAYARKLRSAGVAVASRRDEGMFHGYMSAAGGFEVAREALEVAARAVATALGT